MKTPFNILGVPEDATDNIIKKAYLQKVRSGHRNSSKKFVPLLRRSKPKKQRLKYHHEPPNLYALLGQALEKRWENHNAQRNKPLHGYY